MSTLLYPLKFKPIYKEKIWGGAKLKSVLNKASSLNNIGESWEISAVSSDLSVVSNGFLKGNTIEEVIEIYMGDVVGDPVYDKFGKEFPLLFKFIDAQRDLSIQVHPNDELAKERHQAYGKTEMWYVIDAGHGSRLISGFTKPTNREEYLKALKNGHLSSLLKSHDVKKGQTFFIPAGNVHAIGAGVLLAEIQQTSDVTYRIYDYDRLDEQGDKRELHTELALDAINFEGVNEGGAYDDTQINTPVNLVECPYFATNMLNLNSAIERDIYILSSFVVYMCVGGSAKIIYSGSEEETISFGETVLIPVALESITIQPQGNVKLLEVYVKE
jgi:mannose-6-phosphate isomerase